MANKQSKKMAAVESAKQTASEIMDRIKARHGVGTSSTNRLEKALEKGKPKSAPKSKPAPAPTSITDKPKAEPKPKAPKVMPICACGCGGTTKGGTYLPGHDSKHRSALAGPKEMPDCQCGCGGKTKGGRFLPGHDAKYHSAQKKAAKEAQAQSKAQAA